MLEFNARFNPNSPYFIDVAFVMMQLGEFQFSIASAAYQSLQRKTQYAWQSQDRLNNHSVWQYTAKPQESLQLDGVIYPQHKGGARQIETLREQAALGEALILVDGMGLVYGQWVILSVEETQSTFNPIGMPLKQTFKLELKRYGD